MIFYKSFYISKTKAERWLYIKKKLFNILSDITKLSKSIKYAFFYIYNYIFVFSTSIPLNLIQI